MVNLVVMHKFDSAGVAEKLSWEKPERKDQAGSLVVFGGVGLKLKEINSIFSSAKTAGASSVVILVPESLARGFKLAESILNPVSFNSHFGLTDSGLRKVRDEFGLVDALILADLGRNSETQFKLLNLISHSYKPVIVTSFAAELFSSELDQLSANPNITLILNFPQFQKLYKTLTLKTVNEKNIYPALPPLSTQSLKLKIKVLATFQTRVAANIILVEEGHVIATSSNKIDGRYLRLNFGKDIERLISRLALWQVWAPGAPLLEQLFMASSSRKDL
jgi:hypothetical protein